MGKEEKNSYLAAHDVDYTARMCMALLSELWITRDRVAVLERILVEKGVIGEAEVNDFVPTEPFKSEILKLRDVVVQNVVGAPLNDAPSVNELKEKGKAVAKPPTN